MTWPRPHLQILWTLPWCSRQSIPPIPLIYGQIKDYLEARGIEQSPYSSYQYDAVWLLGLSILHAQSADSLDVREQLPFTAMNYVGAIGSAKLDDNGDRERAAYWEWELEDGDWIPYVPPLPAEPQKICR